MVVTQVQGLLVPGSGLRDMKIQRFEEIEAWQLTGELSRKDQNFVRCLAVNQEP